MVYRKKDGQIGPPNWLGKKQHNFHYICCKLIQLNYATEKSASIKISFCQDTLKAPKILLRT